LEQTQELELIKVATDSKKTIRINFLKFSQATDSKKTIRIDFLKFSRATDSRGKRVPSVPM
jgi:hypothetical protein